MSAHKLSVGSSFVRESMCEWNLWSHCASAPCQSKLMTQLFIPFCLKMVGSLPPVTKTSCAPSPDARSTGSSTPVHNQDDRRAPLRLPQFGRGGCGSLPPQSESDQMRCVFKDGHLWHRSE